jgi:hypothetical protein
MNFYKIGYLSDIEKRLRHVVNYGIIGYMRLTKNISVFSLPSGSRKLKLLVFFVCAGIFTNVLPNAMLTRQKQGVVALVKKHPIASIMLVGTAWFVYKMIRSYRRTGSVASALPEWFFSLRNRYYKWKKPRSGEDELQRQAEQAADRRTPQHSEDSRSYVFDPSQSSVSNASSVSQPSSSGFDRDVRFQYSEEQTVAQVLDNQYARPSVNVGLDQDDLKGQELFEAAKKRGDSREQNDLGCRFFVGIGSLKQDLVKAFVLFETAAEQGFPDAQANLATCYLVGLGVSKNLSKALSWFRKAADNGSLDSQVLMHHILRKGLLFGQGDILASHYFELIKNALGSEIAAHKKLSEIGLFIVFDKSVVPKDFAGDKCSICQEAWPPVEQDASVSILPCRHCFCQHCFIRWSEEQRSLGRATTCPLCRLVVQQQEIIVGSVV